MTTQRKGRRALTLAVRAPPLAKLLHHILGHDRICGLVNLLGIESPGLTSSLAIAEEVRRRLTN